MSYTTLYRVTNGGNLYYYAEFHNAVRGAWLVWENMAKMYLDKQLHIYDDESVWQDLWALARDPQVKLSHRLVLISTFDHVIIPKENFNALINAMCEYNNDVEDSGTIMQQAKAIENMQSVKNCVGCCWNQNSVMDAWYTTKKRFNVFKERVGWSAGNYINFDTGEMLTVSKITCTKHTC